MQNNVNTLREGVLTAGFSAAKKKLTNERKADDSQRELRGDGLQKATRVRLNIGQPERAQMQEYLVILV